MRPYALLPRLLSFLLCCTHHAPASGGAPAATDYRDFADVRTPGDPDAPLQTATSREAGSSGLTTFFVVPAPGTASSRARPSATARTSRRTVPRTKAGQRS